MKHYPRRCRHDEALAAYVAGAVIAILLITIIILAIKLINARHETLRAKGLLNTQFQTIVLGE